MTERVVVVTGASAGVGRATARAFAERGDAVAPAAARVEAELGPIDVWVNDAMTGVFAPFLSMTAEEFRRVTEVTYLGQVHGTLAALRRMTARDGGRGRGHVVQVGSALAYRGIPLQSAYCGAKHAVQGFTESVRTELLHERSRVRITSVHLPAMNTPQFRILRSKMDRQARPVPPIYQPEVAARAVVWASEHRRREVWVGAPTVATILGNRLAPGLLDRYLGRTGYGSQLIDEPHDPTEPGNLFAPVPGDRGAHGVYDDVAHERSLQLALTRHRPWLVAAGGVLAAAAVGAVAGRLDEEGS